MYIYRVGNLVLVLDEVQYLLEHAEMHAEDISSFLCLLYELPGPKFKFVFAGAEMLRFWYQLTETPPSGDYLPGSAHRLVLPSCHHLDLLNRIDEILGEAGYPKCKLAREQDQELVTTAAQMVEISKAARISGNAEDAFEKLRKQVIAEYNFSLVPLIRLMHKDYTPVLKELFDIAHSPQIYIISRKCWPKDILDVKPSIIYTRRSR